MAGSEFGKGAYNERLKRDFTLIYVLDEKVEA